jgi:hypothetical protein
MKIFRLFIAFTLICFALSPNARGVVPPPPGGYPNFTTAAGDHALQALTLGLGNTALGTFSMFSVTTGNFNTAVGAGALDLNTADSNTAVGTAALLFNTTGTVNTANGTAALEFNTTGSSNTASGAFALFSNTTGGSNTAVGEVVLHDNASGSENTAIGSGALGSNIDGSHNEAVGQAALGNNTHGSNNIAVGEFAGQSVTTSNNVICIGVQGVDVSDSCFIGNIFNATATGGSAVFIDANNKLGTITSSKRFKQDIKQMGPASEALFLLKPVSFRYKKQIDPAGIAQLGLVAEDVEKVNPDLVVRDKEGKPYSVRYDQVNAMLLNEFLKEHKAFLEEQRKVQILEANDAEREREVKALVETVKEQTAQIQKVSAQLEASKPAPQVVNNP